MVQPRLTTISGVIVALDDGAAGVLPVGDADAKKSTFAFFAPEAAVAVRVGLTQASQTQLSDGGQWLACIARRGAILHKTFTQIILASEFVTAQLGLSHHHGRRARRGNKGARIPPHNMY